MGRAPRPRGTVSSSQAQNITLQKAPPRMLTFNTLPLPGWPPASRQPPLGALSESGRGFWHTRAHCSLFRRAVGGNNTKAGNKGDAPGQRRDSEPRGTRSESLRCTTGDRKPGGQKEVTRRLKVLVVRQARALGCFLVVVFFTCLPSSDVTKGGNVHTERPSFRTTKTASGRNGGPGAQIRGGPRGSPLPGPAGQRRLFPDAALL